MKEFTILQLESLIYLFLIFLLPFPSIAQQGNDSLISKPKPILSAIPGGLPYSFTREPFISPKIIEDLSTWISDGGDQVVSINLLASQESNRYFGDIESKVIENEFPYVSVTSEKEKSPVRPVYFAYQFVGKTKNNIFVLRTWSCGGGSFVSRDILFLKLEKDKGMGYISFNDSISYNVERLLLKKICEIPLYEGWKNELKIKGNKVFISTEEWHNENGDKVEKKPESQKWITIDLDSR